MSWFETVNLRLHSAAGAGTAAGDIVATRNDVEALLSAAEAWLSMHGQRLRRYALVPDNGYVRFALLPAQDQLSEAHYRAYAELRMQQIYGELSAGWTVALARARYGAPRLICAMPEKLLAGLRQLFGRRLAAITPSYCQAADRYARTSLSTDYWFCDVGPERLCLGAYADGTLHAFDTSVCGADADEAVEIMAARMAARCGALQDLPIAIHDPGGCLQRIGQYRSVGALLDVPADVAGLTQALRSAA